MLLTVLCLSALGVESFPASLAAERLRDMLQRAHEERDGARLVARKLSVESALLPAFIVQDLAHGCASQDMARSMSYTYGAADAKRCAGWFWPMGVSSPTATIEPGWTCPAGMVWRVRATTERLVCAGPEPAVAIDWIIESDGTSTSAIAERFEPALMPAELDFPLVPWGLGLHWDCERGHALDRSGQSHTEPWLAAPPILANPDDMFDTFDAMRVQHWLSRWPPRDSLGSLGRGPFLGIGDLAQASGPQTIDLDHGPMHWHDPTAFKLVHHGSLQDRSELFRPARLIPNIRGLRAIIEWAPWPIDPSSTTERPTRAPHRIRIVSDEREQAIITFGRFELVPRGATTARAEHDPPWVALRQAIDDRDAITFMAIVLRAQDGLGTVQARARMGIEQAIQALDAAVDAGWSLELLRTVAPDLLDRCMSRLAPAELLWLTLDATMASRGTLAMLAATRLSQHAQASADERAWATMALPSLWAWLHEPPADDSPLGARRLSCDRALRPILLGELPALTAHDGGAS
ncbi:MAG: hypothetical protein QM519_07820 [Bacteroidia bacterium]|nr:hypothetical protein [Bacteroidia bacterium]